MRQQLSADAILGTTEFADFHHAAVQFCEFIEEPPSNLGLGFLHKARQQLIDLYKTAIRLPWVDLKSDVDFDHQIDDKKYKEILDSISIRLGGANFYWHVFDPTNEKDTKAVCGDLVDDLGDIYKDLKYSLMTFDLNLPDCKENALWEFKSGFETHWDDHCINALSAIHFYLQNEWSESPTEIQ